ncbi:MAG: nucleosidase [Marinilabiliaceae bacterium]|nr:nucleosidase [Marinilabiliaceae bacterium]
MKQILIVQALEDERIELPVNDNIRFHHIFTHCGKANAAYSLTEWLLTHDKPDIVINVGTAGSCTLNIGDIAVCSSFIDRDLIPLKELGVDCVLTFDTKGKSICSTGDTFVTDKFTDADVCDMEAFALALTCKRQNLPFVAVKYVTDIVGQNSVKAWEEKLADARYNLTKYINSFILA